MLLPRRLKVSLLLLIISVTTLVLIVFSSLYRPVSAQSVETPCNGIQLASIRRSLATSIALQQGFFAQEGLNVCFNQVSGSAAIFNGLFAGDYDIISTAADNAVNRYVNSDLPVQIVAGIEKGTGIALVANTARGINSVEDLRGLPIAVDAPDSGYVFALRKILAEKGLFLENGDYSLQVVGGTSARYQSLIDGQTSTNEPVYATVLLYPFTILSENQPNAKVLERFSDYVTPYQSTVFAVTRDYANTQGDTIVAFLRAYIKASQFATDPANREVVLASIASELDVPLDIAAQQLDSVLDETTGENRNAQLDEQGLINVIDLRQEFNSFNRPVNSVKLARPRKGGLYDDRYWLAAINSLSSVTAAAVPKLASANGLLLAVGIGGVILVLKRR